MESPERAIRDYLLTKRPIHDLIAGQIYIARIPKDATKTVLVISRTSTLRDYSLNFGEELDAQALIGLDVYSRELSGISLCYSLAEQIRIELSGFIGDMGNVCFSMMSIDNENYIATPNQDASDDWVQSYSTDYRVTYSQPKTLVTSYGDS